MQLLRCGCFSQLCSSPQSLQATASSSTNDSDSTTGRQQHYVDSQTRTEGTKYFKTHALVLDVESECVDSSPCNNEGISESSDEGSSPHEPSPSSRTSSENDNLQSVSLTSQQQLQPDGVSSSVVILETLLHRLPLEHLLLNKNTCVSQLCDLLTSGLSSSLSLKAVHKGALELLLQYIHSDALEVPLFQINGLQTLQQLLPVAGAEALKCCTSQVRSAH